MLEAGRSIRNVAARFLVSPSTILEIRRRYVETGAFNDRPRSDRPRVTHPRQDRYNQYMVLSHLLDRIRGATSTAAITIGTHGRPISHDTVG